MLERVDLSNGDLMNLAAGGAIAAASGLAMLVPLPIIVTNNADMITDFSSSDPFLWNATKYCSQVPPVKS